MAAPLAQGSAMARWAAQYQGSPIMLKAGTGIVPVGSDVPISFYTDTPYPNDPPFAQYMPLPGASLLRNQAATFPFLNQAVAGNAVIQQPVTLSMMMVCPAQVAWSKKTSIMTSLIQTLKQHINLGGLFNADTPASPYLSGILLDLRDVSQNETTQPQYKYQWDLYFPLITLDQAQAVLNTLLQKLSDQGSPAPALPTVANGLAQVGATTAQLSQSITGQLAPQLTAAGLDTAALPGVVSSGVGVAIAGNFSPTELANHLAFQYLPNASATGMSYAAVQGLMQSGVGNALYGLGVTPYRMQTLFKAAFGSVTVPNVASGVLQ